jgi:hypothetical protein
LTRSDWTSWWGLLASVGGIAVQAVAVAVTVAVFGAGPALLVVGWREVRRGGDAAAVDGV